MCVAVHSPRQLSGASDEHVVLRGTLVPAPAVHHEAVPPASGHYVYTCHRHGLRLRALLQGMYSCLIYLFIYLSIYLFIGVGMYLSR